MISQRVKGRVTLKIKKNRELIHYVVLLENALIMIVINVGH